MIGTVPLVILTCIVGVAVCSIENVIRRSSYAPFTSCNSHAGIPTVLKCYRHCLRHHDVFYLISHDSVMDTCYCCRSAPGKEDIFTTGEGLQSYITGHCPADYDDIQYGGHRICLKYVESSEKYQDAVAICSREGGDVIRLDSKDKHNILRSFVEGERTLSAVEVWVQGVEDNGTWRYHDGSEFTYTCLTGDSDNPAEIYMRARSQANYNCNDAGDWRSAFYVCEMYVSHVGFPNPSFT